MDSGRLYDIRPQARGTGQDNALEGVFRVFLSTDALAVERLKQGDWVQLRNRATGKGGLGIAWRVQESNLKKDCVKVHDSLREMYGFELKDKLSLGKYEGKLIPISKIVVRDITDKTGAASKEGLETLHMAAGATLYNTEAVAVGYDFTTICRNGSEAARKRQLTVESISPQDSPSTNEGLKIPYFFTKDSQLEIAGSSTPTSHSAPAPTRPTAPDIDATGLFGIDRQIKQLNLKMRDMRDRRDQLEYPKLGRPSPILLYGPPGTGKSTLLRKVSEASWARSQVIRCAQLTASAEKAKKAISEAFKEAKTVQPSCIVLDGIEKIASSQSEAHESVIDVLEEHLTELRKDQTQVLVVAATQKFTNIHEQVARCFDMTIELPIPTERVRLQILNDMMEGTVGTSVLQPVAERTPAFVADDLRRLCSVAIDRARERTFEQEEAAELSKKNLVNGDQTSLSTGVFQETGRPKLEFLMSDFEHALNQVHASVMHEAYIEVPKVHWTDIGGSETVKQKFEDILGLPLKHGQMMSDFQLEPSTGVLLYGPPGCSKTLTAKAVATESGRNFIAVKGPELISKYVGESEYKIREVFRRARDAAPSVIFFDEIDSIAPRRDSGGSHEGLNTVAALLNEMDGIEGVKGVLVLAATNRPDHIDPALLRPQRLGTLLYLGPPGPDARKQILHMKTSGRRPDPALDIDALVTRTEGYSGADIVELCNLAALQAVKEAVRGDGNGEQVRLGITHFEEAFGEMKPTLSADVVRYLEEWQVAEVTKI